MTESKDPSPGDNVQLLGLDGETPLPDLFEIVKPLNKVSYQVKSQQNTVMNVHKSRIARIVKRGEPQQIEAKALAKEARMSEEEAVAVAERPTVAAKPAVKPVVAKPEKPVAEKEKAAPKVKEVKQPIPFDLKAWLREHNNGVHLIKPAKFDHGGFKLVAHAVIDEKGGYYYTFNTYQYPGGIISRGKKDAGGNQYALKGHRITIKKETKKGEVSEIQKGRKTAEEMVVVYEKKGYKKD